MIGNIIVLDHVARAVPRRAWRICHDCGHEKSDDVNDTVTEQCSVTCDKKVENSIHKRTRLVRVDATFDLNLEFDKVVIFGIMSLAHTGSKALYIESRET